LRESDESDLHTYVLNLPLGPQAEGPWAQGLQRPGPAPPPSPDGEEEEGGAV